MTLLENWRNKAYGDATDDRQKEEIWKNYFIVEKGIYEKILKNPKDVIKCTVAELATKFDTDIQTITGFLDGKDITYDEFLRLQKNGADIVTSQPSPEEVMNLWTELLKEYDSIIHIPMTSGLSGS